MPVVLVTPPVLHHKSGRFSKCLQDAGLEVRFPTPSGKQLTNAQLHENLPGVEFCLAGSEPWTAETFRRFPQVAVCSRCGVGYDTVDVERATAHGVAVGYTPGANHDSVAELTFALLLGLAKQTLENHDLVKSLVFKRRSMTPVRGRVLGLVGLGRIGFAVARRALAFDMKVLAADPYVDPATAAAAGVEITSLEQVLQRSDFVSLHAPGNAETKHLMNAATFAKMKPGSFLINTARGSLVHEGDLKAALTSGHIAGAGLDVFEDEPPVGSPILDAPNVLFAPHIAGIDVDAIDGMALMAAQTIVDLYEGRWPTERLVNGRALGSNWSWKTRATHE